MSGTSECYDVVIVGARVAGSTLAALVGRIGARTLVLDQARFPSDTLSTHVVFDDSFSVWEDAGAWQRVKAIGAVEMSRVDWRRSAPDTDVSGPILGVRQRNYSLCLRRILLDAALLENARETPGVTVRTGAKVTDVLWEDGRVVGVRFEEGEASSRRSHTARASLVVGADGRLSFVARRVGAQPYGVVQPLNFPFYSYLVDVEPANPPAFELFESPELGTVMLTPCEADVFMGVVYTPQERYEEFRRNHERHFWDRFTADPRLAPRLERAKLIAPIRGRGDLVNLLRVPAGPGWALVGDSGQHKDPIFGQGIGDACRTATLLAAYIAKALSGELGWDSALAEFHARRDADLLPGYDLMINRKPHKVDPKDFEFFWREVGRSASWSERFLNVFTGAIPLQAVYNADALTRFRADIGARGRVAA